LKYGRFQPHPTPKNYVNDLYKTAVSTTNNMPANNKKYQQTITAKMEDF